MQVSQRVGEEELGCPLVVARTSYMRRILTLPTASICAGTLKLGGILREEDLLD